jgi:hypothetical protein
MERYDFYKSLYDHELSQRQVLDGALNTPLSGLLLLGGIIGVYAKDLTLTYEFWPITSLVTILVASICFARTLWLLILSWRITGYKYLQPANAWLDWDRQSELSSQTPLEMDEEFVEEAISKHSQAATFNRRMNTRKSTLLYMARRNLVVTIFAVLLGLIPFLVRTYNPTGTIYKIKVLDSVALSTSLMQNNTITQQPRKADTAVAQKATDTKVRSTRRDKAPANVILREDKWGRIEHPDQQKPKVK